MDKTIVCRDCGTNFTFTEGEQAFFSTKGYTEPQRCTDCRAAKKASRGNDGYSSGGGYSSSGGSSYGNSSYDRPRAPREMTAVTCSSCGKETEVPFVPTGDRPVYCSDCFSQQGGGRSSGGGGSRRY